MIRDSALQISNQKSKIKNELGGEGIEPPTNTV